MSTFTSFLRLVNIPLYVYIYTTLCLLIHLLMGTWVVSTFVNSAATNMGVQISLPDSTFNSLEFTPRGEIAGSYVNYIFNFLRN